MVNPISIEAVTQSIVKCLLYATQWDQIAMIHQKLDCKICEIYQPYLSLQLNSTVWQMLILLKFARKSHEIISDELIFGGFKPFETNVCN